MLTIIDAIIGFYLNVLVLRFLLELFQVNFRNPLVQSIAAICAPPLRIMRRFVPQLNGIDLAAVVLIWLVALFKFVLPLFFIGASFNWGGALLLSLADGLNAVVWIFLLAVLARVVLSWVAPHTQHPAAQIVGELSEPLLAPFRRILPSFGGLDLSPVLTLLSLRLVQQLLLAPLTEYGGFLLRAIGN